MSRRRAGISPSLFPFLAVLICTLGTLILLLALVAQDAKEAAVATLKQEQQDKLAAAAKPDDAAVTLASSGGDTSAQLSSVAAEQMIQHEQFRLRELVSYRDQQTADLEKKRDEITQVEAHMRKIKENLVALSTEVETATANDKPASDMESDEHTLLLIKAEGEKLRADIKELESSERGSKPRVVIVPHRGPNGTQRRPVYVICDAEGLKVMPEGVRITRSQAIAATESDSPLSNPLGSALRVARRFGVQQYGDKEPPYPLLIVRPDGIYMFRVASALMKDWDDQYGYELVPSEVDLAFPGGDQVLRKDMEVAVEEAAARNYTFAGSGGGGSRGRGRGTGGSGGAGSGESFDASSPEATLASNASGADGGDSAGTNGSAAVNSASGPTTRPKRSLPTLSARDLDQQAQNKGYSPARDQRFAPGTYNEPPGSRSGGYGAAPTVQSNSDALNDFLSGQSSPGIGDAPEKNSGSAFGEFENNQQSESFAKNASDGGPGGEGPNGQANISGGSSATGTSATASATMPKPTGQAGMPESASAAKNASNSNPIAMALSDAGHAGSTQSGTASGSDQSVDASTSATATPQVAQMMVRPEGEDWALPDAFRGMGGTEFVRPISMRLQHDRYELVEQGRVVQTFPFDEGGIYRPTLQLATAIRDRVANWGATMRGGYWKPRLEVSVGPHAEQRFVEFEKLMQNSGVEVTRRTP